MIIVSRESITQKNFNIDENSLSKEELEEVKDILPTKEEKEWMRIFQSTAPELERIRRKMSVCILAEVSVLEENRICYNYAGCEYEILAPKNSFNIIRAFEKGKSEAYSEMSRQGCLKSSDKDIDLEKEPLDSLNLMFKIIDRFFFQIYME